MKKAALHESFNRRIDEAAPFAIREAFNQIRTNLMYSMTDTADGAPVYGITSATEDEGKSTVIINLAISFAQLDKKVLLIDGDLRCPTLYKFFDIDERKHGLSEMLSGISSDVITSAVVPNLDIITSGRIPPNPSELITSPRFAENLNEWKKNYDIIFIDFPPIGIVTDSVANCKSISGYIFTVRAGHNSAKNINACIESMEQVGAKIVGIVLNDYNIKGGNSYGSSRYKYGSSAMSKYEISASELQSDKKSSK